jgi:hypothetical protein
VSVLVDYFAHNAAHYKPGSAKVRFTHIRAFCSFLVVEGELDASPMEV